MKMLPHCHHVEAQLLAFATADLTTFNVFKESQKKLPLERYSRSIIQFDYF